MKRPIMWAAVAACIICAVIVRFFPQLLYTDPGIKNGQMTELDLRIEQIEVKEKTIYIYAAQKGAKGQCLITAYLSEHDIKEFVIGTHILARCSCRPFEHARNQGNFDEYDYYRSLGVFERYELKKITGRYGRANPFRQLLFLASQKVAGIINDAGRRMGTAGERAAGIMAAMLTGNKSHVDRRVSDLYRQAGIYHILAVSGLHVSFIGMGIFRLLGKRMRRSIAAVIATACVFAFCIMCNEGTSALRAAIMFAISLGALLLGRKYDILNSLSLAAILLLIHNPFYIQNAAFRLSFTAIWAIAVPSAIITECFGKLKAAAYFSGGFAVTLCTLPFTINMYYGFPVYGLFLNLLIIPALTWILAAGAGGTVIGMIFPVAGRFFMAAGLFLLILIERICILITCIPGSYLICGHVEEWRISLYYLLIGAMLLLARQIIRRKRSMRPDKKECGNYQHRLAVKTAICVPLFTSLLLAVLLFKPARTELEVFCIDVDQGQCVVIRTPKDHVYMFDAGSTSVNDVYRYRIDSALKYQGISEIDSIFLSHPDTDHISAVFELLDTKNMYMANADLKIGSILTPFIFENENFQNLQQAAKRADVPLLDLKAGTVVSDGELTVQCIHPAGDFRSSDINDYSAVLSVDGYDFSCIFTGDISEKEEQRLMRNNTNISGEDKRNSGLEKSGALELHERYDLYIGGHHGSRTSNSSGFLQHIYPAVTVISAGVDNRYGHPHKETLNRLNDIGSKVFITAQSGEIILRAEGGHRITVETILK